MLVVEVITLPDLLYPIVKQEKGKTLVQRWHCTASTSMTKTKDDMAREMKIQVKLSCIC